MKLINSLLILLVSLTTAAQVVIDRTIATRYKQACEKLDSPTQETMKSIELKEDSWGVLIFTRYQVDTLNKDELRGDLSKIIVTNIGDTIPQDPLEQNTYIPVPFLAKLSNDTLHLIEGVPFPPNLHHYIHMRKVKSFYQVYRKYDSLFRLDLNMPKVSKLDIPTITTKFILSNSSYPVGEVLYGQVAFETSSYYIEDSDFKNSYISQRLRGEYVFKVRVSRQLLY